jgi:hypothetical protein
MSERMDVLTTLAIEALVARTAWNMANEREQEAREEVRQARARLRKSRRPDGLNSGRQRSYVTASERHEVAKERLRKAGGRRDRAVAALLQWIEVHA